MGSQVPLVNDRSRTYWTPVMERYFIELMLEHMHNRSGHTFNKQAWTEILTVFNARFDSQYDKDVLKSRYTNLWKQFNDVNNILGRNGFSWDEKRQMVVADDYIWDTYLQAHPDARCYRNKAILNYNDLSKIYGHTTADGRYSRSSHDMDVDDDVTGANTADGVSTLLSSGKEQSRTDWTHDMDRFFVELMLDHIRRGNKVDNTFNKQAWTDMLAEFNSKFGPQHGKRVLRHRYKKLGKYYSEARVILQLDGFSWDETRQMITAGRDVWDTFIKVHPFARSYKTKAVPNYKDLALIFGTLVWDAHLSDSCQKRGFEENTLMAKAGEESQVTVSVERSRTYWTPPMDRCLIELFLTQVHNGNILGKTFISKGWIDMITEFNARFGTLHDKDVLKNRYKHFRRQFNEIQLLLQQNGFSWDEKRNMVVAEDNIWDAYIKVHPDARAYRVKTIPGYQNLCAIFGQENSDGVYSRLAGSLDYSGNSFPDLITGEENDGNIFQTSAPSVIWSPQVEGYFITILIEQVHAGNSNDHRFDEVTWTNMTLLLNERFELNLVNCILEDRYLSLMKQYDEITALLNHGGFSLDETQKVIVAEDAVWEDYTKENPHAIVYKTMNLENYPSLCSIFGSRNSYGGFNFNILEIEINDSALGVEPDGIPTYSEPGEANRFKKRSFLTPPRKASPRKARKITMDTQQEAVVTPSITDSAQNCIPIENAIAALNALPDIDEGLYFEALDLMEDDRKAKTFVDLDAVLRKKWLLRKLRPL